MNDNHAYHSIEYFNNFNSLIVIGVENSNSCEIMDLDRKRWNRLPSLNHPGVNANIYYNNITSDLFVLFGMEGKMDKNIKNTDIIFVPNNQAIFVLKKFCYSILLFIKNVINNKREINLIIKIKLYNLIPVQCLII